MTQTMNAHSNVQPQQQPNINSLQLQHNKTPKTSFQNKTPRTINPHRVTRATFATNQSGTLHLQLVPTTAPTPALEGLKHV